MCPLGAYSYSKQCQNASKNISFLVEELKTFLKKRRSTFPRSLPLPTLYFLSALPNGFYPPKSEMKISHNFPSTFWLK